MPDASQEPREWRFYVNDLIEFAEKVQLFTDGMDQDTFIGRAHFNALGVGKSPPRYEVTNSVEELLASMDAG